MLTFRNTHNLLNRSTVALLSFIWISSGLAQEEDPIHLSETLDVAALYEPIASLEIHGETAVNLLEELQTKHYRTVEVDDNFSSAIFDSLIDTLDNSHIYFLRSDIDELSKYRYTLDDSLKSGSVEPGFEVYNTYYKRVLERLIYAINGIENDIPEMNFSVDEYIQLDREDAPYAESVAELDEIWRLRIKNSVLSLRLTGDDNEEIKDKLSKRYRNQLSQVLKTNERDIFQTFLSTVAKTVDPHTAYFSPRDSENFNMGLSLSLQGIGAQLTTEDEYTKICS